MVRYGKARQGKDKDCVWCGGIRKVALNDPNLLNDPDSEFIKERLVELRMCYSCYDEWTFECWCAACVTTTAGGKEYCLCSQCDCYQADILCPHPRKACGVYCEGLLLIKKDLFERRMERREI